MVDGLVCLLLTVPCILGLSAHLPDGAAHDAKVRHAVALPEPIVIKPFHPEEGAREGTEKVLSSCSTNLPHLP
jgi:hypothetical protein